MFFEEPVSLRDFANILFEAFFSGSREETDEIARSDVLIVVKHLHIPLLILACLSIVITIPITYPSSRYIVIYWVFCLVLYLIIYYKTPLRQFLRGKLTVHAFLGIGAILILHYSLITIGYELHRVNSPGILILYLLPLLLVCKTGMTKDWFRVAAGLSGTIIGFQISIVIIESGFVLAEIWQVTTFLITPEMLTTYGMIFFILFIGATFYALVREMHNYQALIKAEQEMTSLLTLQPSFSAAYQKVADSLIKQQLKGDNFSFILLWDKENERLKLVANAGRDLKLAQNIELDKCQGITGRVIKTGKPILVNNVHDPKWKDIYYEVDELKDVRSELAVPIKYQENLIGVLDVESPKVNAFDKNHQALLEAWADALAITYKHFETIDIRTAMTHQLIQDVIKLGQEYSNKYPTDYRIPYKRWFANIGALARDYFGADIVAFIRLGIGTGYPIFPPIIWPEKDFFRLKRMFIQKKELANESIIWKLIEDWQITCWCSGQDWEKWNTPADNWIFHQLREVGISSLSLVPIGDVERPIGMFFIGYFRPELITEFHKLALAGFGTAIEKSYWNIFPWSSELQQVGLRIHQRIIPNIELLFAYLSKMRKEIRQLNLEQDSVNKLEEDVNQCAAGLRKLREHIKFVTFQERYDLGKLSLDEALRLTANDFEETRPEELRISLRGLGAVEDEDLLTRQTLYWVAVEAISNAVEHGKANLIVIEAQRTESFVLLTVKDDGKGLPAKPNFNNPYGIFHLKRFLKQVMAANLDIKNTEPTGVEVFLQVPVRPR